GDKANAGQALEAEVLALVEQRTRVDLGAPQATQFADLEGTRLQVREGDQRGVLAPGVDVKKGPSQQRRARRGEANARIDLAKEEVASLEGDARQVRSPEPEEEAAAHAMALVEVEVVQQDLCVVGANHAEAAGVARGQKRGHAAAPDEPVQDFGFAVV